jgi:hypothetical protein
LWRLSRFCCFQLLWLRLFRPTALPALIRLLPCGMSESDIDQLFVLPLEQFTAARNALAARLKKSGQADEAERVKALGKPSVSAWAVNQIYWKHRAAFDRLISTGERLLAAQKSQLSGKAADVRTLLDARREVLSELSQLADSLLQQAGHSPTPDKSRRITTTLEALSVSASLPDVRAGRLTDDVDPPGFEFFASLIPATRQTPVPAAPPPAQARKVVELEDAHRGKQTAAKAALRNAERALAEAKTRVQNADAALKTATAQAKETAKQKREAEQRLEKAIAESENAEDRVRITAAEAEKAVKALKDAEQAVEDAAKVIRSL